MGNHKMAEEIKAILADPAKMSEVCKAAFSAVDTDGSGSISQSELMTAMKAMSADAGIPEPNQEQCDEAMKALDTNQDGKVSLEEFSVLVKAILEAIASG